MTLARDAVVPVCVTVNGTVRNLALAPGRLLIDVLREDLGLTGTKEGCSDGICGACGVLVDGELQSACLLPIALLDGRTVTTIEGLSGPDGEPSRLQLAFARHGGIQCGFCTPGMIVGAAALLAEQPDPSEDVVREFLAGNLCRCTGYFGIVESIRAAAADGLGSGASA